MPRNARTMSTTTKIRVVAAALFIAACACNAAAIIVINWIGITRGAVAYKYGLWYLTRSDESPEPSKYTQVSFDDISVVCSRSGTDMEIRNNAARATAVAGLILAFLAAVSSALDGSKTIKLQAAMGFVATFLQIFTAAWVAFIYENWYYCSRSPCDFERAKAVAQSLAVPTCSSKRGHSWNLEVAAAAMSFVGTILVFVALALRKPSLKEAKAPVPKRPAAAASSEEMAPVASASIKSTGAAERRPPSGPVSKPAAVREAAPGPKVGTAEARDALPAGDWVFDEQSGLYWSAKEKLFLHLETAMFYDPDTGMWCNNDGEWFHPDQQA